MMNGSLFKKRCKERDGHDEWFIVQKALQGERTFFRIQKPDATCSSALSMVKHRAFMRDACIAISLRDATRIVLFLLVLHSFESPHRDRVAEEQNLRRRSSGHSSTRVEYMALWDRTVGSTFRVERKKRVENNRFVLFGGDMDEPFLFFQRNRDKMTNIPLSFDKKGPLFDKTKRIWESSSSCTKVSIFQTW